VRQESPGEILEVDTRLLTTDLFTLLAPPASMRMEASTSLPLIRAPIRRPWSRCCAT
jgi:hypothetical protein